MHPPVISVIVPCYNQSRFLNETLISILHQKYSNWECIIVNDGSTDNTEQIARQFCDKDGRFRYVYKINGGLSSARNVGIREAKGNYIQFLDSDDIILHDKFLEDILHVENNESTDICVSEYKLFTTDSTKSFDTPISLRKFDCTLNGFLYSWNSTFVFPPVCCFVKKDFLVKNNIVFNENVKAFEDWIFLIQLSLNQAVFHVHEKTLALYRRHSSNMTNDINFMSRYAIKASFIVYEILPVHMKEKFINSIDKFILNLIRDLLDFDLLYGKANSKDYFLGNKILTPFRFISHFSKKVLRKFRKML
jgi:hypothetical protein